MEDKYKVVCAVSNSATFDDLGLSDPEPQFQGYGIKFKGDHLANGVSDPLRVWF